MIVSDSTTLIILWDLKRMELLGNLFALVRIPEAVYRELSAKSPVELPEYFSIEEVAEPEKIRELSPLLDRGEIEAILLAERHGEPLIIDEKKGRKIAKNRGIRVIGLLGILYLNVKKGYLSREEAEAFLEEAIAHGYRIAPGLIAEMFRALDAENKGK